ncbi:rhomboid family intramembrane serine protease [Nocardia alni]|uniref:rhomboid family intramembrane serine protease n=1 Tax=Nocardia alni TaxID=2815723 RepID=UPI0020B4119A|nr:rhomboid family intramembrane serine protease [Nocardia alni]
MTTPMGSSFDPDRVAGLRAGLERSSGARSSGALNVLWRRAIVWTVGFVVLLYAIQGVNSVTGYALDRDAGIRPRSLAGLDGVVFAPLLHGSWPHLLGNTLPVVVLGLLTLLTGIGRGLVATAIIWVVSGLGAWLISAGNSVTIGASGLVFGWLIYLILRGVFTRNVWQIVLGVVVGLLYGGILLGVLPGQPGISWQGHLFGAVGGVIAAWVLSGNERRLRRGGTPGRLPSAG